MPKPEWGTKRICQACETRFYDLRRQPVLCPKCNAKFVFEAPGKNRRPRDTSAAVEKKPAVKKKPKTGGEEVPAVLKEIPEAVETEGGVGGAGRKEESLIEDTSELGEDEDDMAEVKVNMEEPDE